MHLVFIKEGSTIIAPSYLHQTIRKSLLTDCSALSNIRITTLAMYLNTRSKQDNSIYSYYKTLKKLQNAIHYNKKTLLTYSYIHEVATFIEEMKRYGINTDSLSEENPFTKENKEIIKTLYPISTNADFVNDDWKKALQFHDFSNVYIYDPSSSYYEEKIYTSFIEKGAKRIHDHHILESKQWYSALNQRQEIESIAQMILKQKMKAEDIHIALLNTSYLPYIHQIFTRYKIPYSVVNEKEKADILQRFIACIQYYLHPNSQTLRALFAAHVFEHEEKESFMEYISLHNKDIWDSFSIMDDVTISEDVLSKQELLKLRSLEAKASLVKNAILDDMKNIFTNKEPIEVLLAIDAYINKTHPFHKKEDREALLNIRSEIKKAKEILKSKEDLSFFLSILTNMETNVYHPKMGICVSSFEHAIYRDIQFVVGCSQENFPNFKAKTGIFDETYFARLKYPSMEERYAFHMEKAMYFLQNCKHLICFSSISNIDGKACETSLEIEIFMERKPTRYPLEDTYARYSRTYKIDENSAKQLFTKENIIHGSISSLEKYVKCPYSYFLKYGLKIQEPVDYTFNVAKCGTLLHYVLETLINKYKKEYIYSTEEEINTILEEKINEIMQVYPNEKYTLIHLQKRLVKAIMVNLEILKDMEIHSSLTPSECEYRFDYPIKVDDTFSIALHGIIDRIDTNHDFIRVIDYKSSAHSLKENHVFSAQQLQLITYLMIAQDLFHKRPLGAFYYSLALPPIKMEAGKLKRRPLGYINYSAEDYYASFLKENRMHGWICGCKNYYIEPMDDTGSHIVGVSNSKANGLSARTVYHFDILCDYMKKMYEIIGKNILKGDINADCSEDACLYCPYTNICMKANQTVEKAEIIEVTKDLYLKGGRKDASME